MSKQITITIPNDLAKRLENFKKTKAKINISKICQTAIYAEIRASEQKNHQIQEETKEKTEMEGILQRLRKEKDEVIRGDYLFGHREGTKWVKRASYTQLIILGERWKTSNEIAAGATFNVKQLQEEFPEEFREGYRDDLDNFFFDMSNRYANISLDGTWRISKYFGGDGPTPGESSQDCPPEYRQFEDGFVQAVRDFWSQIKDRL